MTQITSGNAAPPSFMQARTPPLLSLTHIDAANLKGTLMVKASLLALKVSRQNMHQELPRLVRWFAEMTQQQSSLGMIRVLLRYICLVDNDTNLTEYIKQIEALKAPALEEELMTIAEQLRKEGRQQGMQQGMRQGMEQGMQQGMQQGMRQGMQQGMQQGIKQEAAKTLLKILGKRFGSVPKSVEKQISNATTSHIETWIDAALDADNLQEIFTA
jgi:hypothetical protein